jgi:uncharacterized protein (DUF2235 family)
MAREADLRQRQEGAVAQAHHIVLFIDGTWNEASPGEETNVRRLFEASLFEPSGAPPQVTYYLPGVGIDVRQSAPGRPVGLFGPELARSARIQAELPYVLEVARPLLGGGFGLGTQARIKEAYAFLCTQFVRPRQDRVFLFGFSRGAFAARSLAGFVSRVGILLADKLHLVEQAYSVYEQGKDREDTLLAAFLEEFAGARMIRSIEDADALPIHFLGVWDTVGALGLPCRLRRFTAEHTEHHQVTVPPTVTIVRHALALHELRALFEPLLFEQSGRGDLEQVFFPGAHADVGGGYPPAVSGLADIALRWMADEAAHEGLRIDATVDWVNGIVGGKVLHHEIRKWFCCAKPCVRWLLERLRDDSDPPAFGGPRALHFHRGVSDHLRALPDRPRYDFFRPSVNEALAEVDRLAFELYIQSRLLGAEPRG